MKILMATMGLDIGGAETHVVELSKQLSQQGHQVIVASNGGVYVSELTAVGIRHVSVPLHRRSAGTMLAARNRLKALIAEERPDIIHAHARIPAFICAPLAKKFSIPFVTTCHGVYQTGLALKLLSDWGEQTLAVSEDVQHYLEATYQLPSEQITLTINGIDTERFAPHAPDAKLRDALALGDGPVICHVSRLDESPAIISRLLFEILPELADEFQGLQLLLVGDGTEFPSLVKQAEQLNHDLGYRCVIPTGRRTDVDRLIALCNIFVGVSRAALEAMASEKVVVLSGAQGHTGLYRKELLQHAIHTNFCCRTDPPVTAQCLHDAIIQALSLSADEAAQLGAEGRAAVLEHYSVQRMTADCLNIYTRVKRPTYRVLMSGYYGFSNAGDDAILQSIHQGIQSASGDIAVTVLSNNPAETTAKYHLDALPRFRFFAVLRALWKCDALLSGGGSLLQDSTSTRSLLYYLAVIRGAEMMGKQVMLYANGIGPVTRPKNRKRVKAAVDRATLVTLRDPSSAQELKNMHVLRDDLHVTADPVFNLAPAPQTRAHELMAQVGLAIDTDFVVISVRDWPSGDNFPQQLALLCDHLHDAYGLSVLFLLMQPTRDRATSEQVSSLMKNPSYLLDVAASPQDLMAVLGCAKLCVAMRLHTLIFAARMSVPLLGLVYDPKVESYLKELEMPSAGYVKNFDSAAAIAAADALMADYDDAHARLHEISLRLAQAAKENEQLLIEMLQSSH